MHRRRFLKLLGALPLAGLFGLRISEEDELEIAPREVSEQMSQPHPSWQDEFGDIWDRLDTVTLDKVSSRVLPEGHWKYDEEQDTWQFWRTSDDQNVVRIRQTREFGPIICRLSDSGITHAQLQRIVFAIRKELFSTRHIPRARIADF